MTLIKNFWWHKKGIRNQSYLRWHEEGIERKTEKKLKLPQKSKLLQLYCLVICVALRRMENTCVNVIIVEVNTDIVVLPVPSVILDAIQDDKVNVGNY